MSLTHKIAFLGFDRVQLLDLVGPLESFLTANQVIKDKQYQTFIIGEKDRFTSESNLKVLTDNQLGENLEIDTLFIPGGVGARTSEIAAPFRIWIDANFDRIERIVTVCTGLFLIADHPYLQNKEVVTHWSYSERLQKLYPQLKVNHERLFIKQGKFYSAAGILSGIDLALNLIEEDHGVDVASYTAKYLVTYLKRSGHQSQFSEPLKFQSHNNGHLDRVNRWLNDNHDKFSTVEELADQIHISERHLNRLIQSHFHMTAAKYIEHIKLEQSKVYLTRSNILVETVSDQLGYRSADTFRRSFKRKYGITPQSYIKRFH